MALSRFERLRNRRQREFESKMLSLATPKEKGRFLSLINAPFTLWLLSAIVLGFGGLYYTTFKQCRIDAAKLAEDYSSYRWELLKREVLLARDTAKAKSFADAKKLQELIPADTKVAKDKPVEQLNSLVSKLSIQIQFDPIEDHPLFAELKNDPNFFRFSEFFKGSGIAIEEKDFPALQAFAFPFIARATLQELQIAPHLIPSCGPSTVLSIVSGSWSSKILRAIPIDEFWKEKIKSVKKSVESKNDG